MTILPSGPLAVNVARSGGLLGRTSTTRAVAEPSSALHRAATALLHAPTPPPSASRSRDGFTYVVTIVDHAAGETLLDTRYGDPAPAALAELLAALAEPPPAD